MMYSFKQCVQHKKNSGPKPQAVETPNILDYPQEKLLVREALRGKKAKM